jgi:Zn-dependent protease
MLWALAQPAALAGLLAAFVLGVGVRAVATRLAARLLGTPARPVPIGVDPLSLVAAAVAGTGWGLPARVGSGPRHRLCVATGPVAVLALSQATLAAYRVAYPRDGLVLRLNRPSDVLHGAVAPTSAALLMLSVAVGLLCFGLLALVPLPPLDGYRILRDGSDADPSRWLTRLERYGVVLVLFGLLVPVAGRPPLVLLLDAVGAPLLRAWA